MRIWTQGRSLSNANILTQRGDSWGQSLCEEFKDRKYQSPRLWLDTRKGLDSEEEPSLQHRAGMVRDQPGISQGNQREQSCHTPAANNSMAAGVTAPYPRPVSTCVTLSWEISQRKTVGFCLFVLFLLTIKGNFMKTRWAHRNWCMVGSQAV